MVLKCSVVSVSNGAQLFIFLQFAEMLTMRSLTRPSEHADEGQNDVLRLHTGSQNSVKHVSWISHYNMVINGVR